MAVRLVVGESSSFISFHLVVFLIIRPGSGAELLEPSEVPRRLWNSHWGFLQEILQQTLPDPGTWAGPRPRRQCQVVMRPFCPVWQVKPTVPLTSELTPVCSLVCQVQAVSVVAQVAFITASASWQAAAAAARLLRAETPLQREGQGRGGHHPQGNIFPTWDLQQLPLESSMCLWENQSMMD